MHAADGPSGDFAITVVLPVPTTLIFPFWSTSTTPFLATDQTIVLFVACAGITWAFNWSTSFSPKFNSDLLIFISVTGT